MTDFSPEFQQLWTTSYQLLNSVGPPSQFSVFEVAKALSMTLNVPWETGRRGGVPHAWLRLSNNVLLDPRAPEYSFPRVVLVDLDECHFCYMPNPVDFRIRAAAFGTLVHLFIESQLVQPSLNRIVSVDPPTPPPPPPKEPHV